MEFQVERIRQQFAMALMYCEFNGDNWLEGELWVSSIVMKMSVNDVSIRLNPSNWPCDYFWAGFGSSRV